MDTPESTCGSNNEVAAVRLPRKEFDVLEGSPLWLRCRYQKEEEDFADDVKVLTTFEAVNFLDKQPNKEAEMEYSVLEPDLNGEDPDTFQRSTSERLTVMKKTAKIQMRKI